MSEVGRKDISRGHWAFDVISVEDRARADMLIDRRLELWAKGRNELFFEADEILFDRVAMAYEMVAVDALSSDGIQGQKETMSRLFDIRSSMPLPKKDSDDRLLHVLQLSAAAWCGDRWPEMHDSLHRNEYLIARSFLGLSDMPWDRRVFRTLANCWLSLFCDNFLYIRERVAEIRAYQEKYEKKCLDNGSVSDNKAVALRLIGFYHWAKATEMLAECMQGQGCSGLEGIDKHFESGIKAMSASGDFRHEVTLRWLQAVGRIMARKAYG